MGKTQEKSWLTQASLWLERRGKGEGKGEGRGGTGRGGILQPYLGGRGIVLPVSASLVEQQ